MNRKILIRPMTAGDCEIIAKAFEEQQWDKPLTQYQNYRKEQIQGSREVLIAEFENEFAGYLTIVWESNFAVFRENEIPEISDLNVLIKFRNRGIGSTLMDAAERLIAEDHETAGIRVGLTRDYGAAQRMYCRRGYRPDGLGISQNGVFLRHGDNITVDDELNLSFTKELNKS